MTKSVVLKITTFRGLESKRKEVLGRKGYMVRCYASVHLVHCYLEVLGGATTTGNKWDIKGQRWLEARDPEICPLCLESVTVQAVVCWNQLSQANGIHFSPTPLSVPSCWWLGINHNGSIYTRELASATNQGILLLDCQWPNTHQALILAAPAASQLTPVLYPCAMFIFLKWKSAFPWMMFKNFLADCHLLVSFPNDPSPTLFTSPIGSMSWGVLIFLGHFFLRSWGPVGRFSSVILWSHA